MKHIGVIVCLSAILASKVVYAGPSLKDTERFLEVTLGNALRSVLSKDAKINFRNGIVVMTNRTVKVSYHVVDMKKVELHQGESGFFGLELFCHEDTNCVSDSNFPNVGRSNLRYEFRRSSENQKVSRRAANALAHYATFFNAELSVTDFGEVGSAFD